MTRAAAIAAVTAGLALGGIWASGAFGDPGLPGTAPTVYRTVTETRTVDRRIEGWNATVWRAHAVANRRALNFSERRRTKIARRLSTAERNSRRAWKPTVREAVALARAVYGVDQTRRTYCESTDSPSASNGSHFGLLQFAASTWASTPFARFSPYDPIAAELAGGWMVAHGRSGEWSCGL